MRSKRPIRNLTLVAAATVALVSSALLAAAPAEAAQHPTVKLSRLSSGTPTAGDPVSLAGTVPSQSRGKKVRVQSRSTGDKAWSTIKTVKASSHGTFTARVVASGQGLETFRAIAAGKNSHTTYTSKSVSVHVYDWQYLSRTSTVASEGYVKSLPASISGTNYPNSVMLDDYGHSAGDYSYAEYNLGRNCTALRAVVGITDTAPSGAAYSTDMTVSVDGVMLWQQSSIVFGTAYPLNVSVTHGLRLHIESSDLTGRVEGDDTYLGNAQLLCTV